MYSSRSLLCAAAELRKRRLELTTGFNHVVEKKWVLLLGGEKLKKLSIENSFEDFCYKARKCNSK